MSSKSSFNDNSSKCFIFDNKSLENYKSLCGKISFIAGNTTICGCLCGCVYTAEFNIRGDVILKYE